MKQNKKPSHQINISWNPVTRKLLITMRHDNTLHMKECISRDCTKSHLFASQSQDLWISATLHARYLLLGAVTDFKRPRCADKSCYIHLERIFIWKLPHRGFPLLGLEMEQKTGLHIWTAKKKEMAFSLGTQKNHSAVKSSVIIFKHITEYDQLLSSLKCGRATGPWGVTSVWPARPSRSKCADFLSLQADLLLSHTAAKSELSGLALALISTQTTHAIPDLLN